MLPLFAEELDGTLNRGAHPEAGHALDLPPCVLRHIAHVCTNVIPVPLQALQGAAAVCRGAGWDAESRRRPGVRPRV